MAIKENCSVALVGLLSVLAALLSRPVAAHSVLDGYWNPSYDEDVARIPGEDQGDYTGIPVTQAAIGAAQAWDPEIDTVPWLECRPHPSVYGLRGIGMLRIWEVRDPQTQKQTQINTWLWAWEAQRQIWMDGRAHPPPWAPHTWQGFSAGHWEGTTLVVHTDMIKRGWTRRNGPPTSDRTTMDERFIRYGDIMTYIRMIVDPQYLSEPAVTSTNYTRISDADMTTWPCRAVAEVPRNEGAVPMHLPNQTAVLIEGAIRSHVPIAAWHGGAQTMRPEYQDYIKTLPPNPPLSVVMKRVQQEDKE
ncbi:MAG TPA: hypothetical protein VHX52_14390 [Steroidobacteraceae bacterium]|jgi:hypothetical protein|nr:hypothetical protein [Steroidobacteraceae bacterium]